MGKGRCAGEESGCCCDLVVKITTACVHSGKDRDGCCFALITHWRPFYPSLKDAPMHA